MSKRARARFEVTELAGYWGDRLMVIDSTSPSTSAAPEAHEDEPLAPNMPRRFVIPRDSHVRVYLGNTLRGIYCGHSQEIEPADLMRVRYREYAEVYCPHSQEWEPLG